MNIRKILRMALPAAAIVFIVGAVVGTLATPIVLSLHYSWYWLFLYAGYLLLTLYVVLYCIRYWHDDEGGTHK